MPLYLPDGARMAVAITCDFDAHSARIGAYKMMSPAALSRGEFGAEVGVPRLLALFRELDIRTTWFTPGHSLVTFPHEGGGSAGRGSRDRRHTAATTRTSAILRRARSVGSWRSSLPSTLR